MTTKSVPAVEAAAASHTARPRARWAVLAIILSAVFMQLLDTTITMVAVPSIQASLKASYGEIQLVVALYMLAFACVLVTGGRLGDTYGRKKMFLLGMAGFALASAVCGAAPDALTLIASRVVQGMSSGLMFPQVLGTIQVIFSRAQRTRAITAYGATIGLATILGPVTGGALIDWNLAGSGWRSIFYVNVPIGLAALALGIAMIPESRTHRASSIDVTGALLLGSGLFLLVLPLVIGRDQGWPAWSFACLGISPFVLAAFVAYERGRTRRDRGPLLSTALFRQRPFTLGLLASLVFFSGIPSFFMILLITLQGGLGYSPVKAGGVTLGFALALAIGSARSAAVARRLGSRILVAGCLLMLAGQSSVIAVMYWQGTSLGGWHLLLPLFVAFGIAVVGVIFFGLIGHDAGASSSAVLPALRGDLTAAGLPAPAQRQVIAGFRVCFDDRAHAKDPSGVPASCAAIQRQVTASPAPARVKAEVVAAVRDTAVPQARRYDLEHSMRITLSWQLGVFFLALLLVARLPKVRLDGDALTPGGA